MQYLMTKEEFDEAIAHARNKGIGDGRSDLAATMIAHMNGHKIVARGLVGLEAELVDTVYKIMEKLVAEGKRAEEWKRKAEGYALKEAQS